MSYSRANCRTSFSHQQVYAMKHVINNNSVFNNIINNNCSIPKLVGSNLICSNLTYTYTLQNSTIPIWTLSDNLEYISSTDSTITVKAKYSNTQGSGDITVTFNNGVEILREVHLGKPYAYAGPAEPICINQFIQDFPYTLQTSPGAESYRLVSSSPYLTISGSSERIYSYAPVDIDFISSKAGTYRVDLYTENECGISQGAIYVTSENVVLVLTVMQFIPTPLIVKLA